MLAHDGEAMNLPLGENAMEVTELVSFKGSQNQLSLPAAQITRIVQRKYNRVGSSNMLFKWPENQLPSLLDAGSPLCQRYEGQKLFCTLSKYSRALTKKNPNITKSAQSCYAKPHSRLNAMADFYRL